MWRFLIPPIIRIDIPALSALVELLKDQQRKDAVIGAQINILRQTNDEIEQALKEK